VVSGLVVAVHEITTHRNPTAITVIGRVGKSSRGGKSISAFTTLTVILYDLILKNLSNK
jgi:hypothetical protein